MIAECVAVKPQLIINADDFGLSPQINAGIARAFDLALINSCTLMANGPAFEEACEFAHTRGFAARVGLHFVLDEGRPLTGELRRERRFCGPDGQLRRRTPHTLLFLSASEAQAVVAEFRAQVARCREFGIPLTHADSHHHIHEELGVIRAIAGVMREVGIPFVRPMRNLQRSRSLLRSVYAAVYNAALGLQRLSRCRYFGSVQDFKEFKRLHARAPEGAAELMVHPAIDSNGLLVDREVNCALADLVEGILA